MKYTLKFVDKAQFEQVFTSVLEGEGITLSTGYEFQRMGNINQTVSKTIEEPGIATGEVIEVPISELYNIDWIVVKPRARNTSGEFINDGTPENPIWVYDEGYFVNVVSNKPLEIPAEYKLHLEDPQFKWA